MFLLLGESFYASHDYLKYSRSSQLNMYVCMHICVLSPLKLVLMGFDSMYIIYYYYSLLLTHVWSFTK